jgi:two-component sensor histidine kinase
MFQVAKAAILVVEDEAMVRWSTRDGIEASGFQVVDARDADEAIKLLEANPDIGSNVEAATSAAVPLAMAINELWTNAAKYGALSRPGGRVEITAETDELQNQFCLRWRERGGPLVRPPTRQGRPASSSFAGWRA